MMTFLYTARRKTGEKTSGEVTANNRAEAVRKLEQMSLVPVSLICDNPPALSSPPSPPPPMNPNLLACPACKNDVSKAAIQCPSCGHPMSQKSYLTKDIGIGGFVYTLIALIGLMTMLFGVMNWIVLLFFALGITGIIIRLKMWIGAAPK